MRIIYGGGKYAILGFDAFQLQLHSPPPPLPATSNLNLGANGPRRQKGRCKRSIVEIFHHYSFEQYTAFLYPLPINYPRCQHNIVRLEQLFFSYKNPFRDQDWVVEKKRCLILNHPSFSVLNYKWSLFLEEKKYRRNTFFCRLLCSIPCSARMELN